METQAEYSQKNISRSQMCKPVVKAESSVLVFLPIGKKKGGEI